MKYTLLFLFFFSIQSYAQAPDDIQYVTGKLYLSLYEQADAGSKVIKSLVSGDRLDVIEIAGPYAKVITDNGQEGWVKKGFLVKDKPARILYLEVNEAYEKLQKDIAERDENVVNVGELQEKLTLLETEYQGLKVKNDNLEHQLKRSKEAETVSNTSQEHPQIIELNVFKQFIEEYLYFLIASLIAVILIGYRLGQLNTESKVIKHFGGVKVW